METTNYLYVNTTPKTNLKASFDISFPEIACSLLTFDAIDENGAVQIDAKHEIFKHKLSKMGAKHGEPEQYKIGNNDVNNDPFFKLTKEQMEKTKMNIECGNCYGAGYEGQCCNTCDDVKLAYERKGWRFKPQGIQQCNNEAFINNAKDQYAIDGGCQIYGTLELQSTGHFHISPIKKIVDGNLNTDAGLFNVLEFLAATTTKYNLTHTINSLNFGDQFPGLDSPLDGQKRDVENIYGMYQYYLKIVPTIYETYDKGVSKEIESNQYSVTEHIRKLSPGSGRGLPGIYFYYELSPISAKFTEKRKNGFVFRFITSLCALIGGAYNFMWLLDIFLQYVKDKFFSKSNGIL